MWPFKQKTYEIEVFECVKPNDATIRRWALGDVDIYVTYVIGQHVTWAYSYIGEPKEIPRNSPVMARDIHIMVLACQKYWRDNKWQD